MRREGKVSPKRVTPNAGQVDALDSDICYEITDVAVDRHVLQNHNCRTMVLTKRVSSHDDTHETGIIARRSPRNGLHRSTRGTNSLMPQHEGELIPSMSGAREVRRSNQQNVLERFTP